MVGSAIYISGMATYAIIQRGPVWEMAPNAFADFLAGTFAPLAFLWLVLGFLQQGEELRNSGEALTVSDQRKLSILAASKPIRRDRMLEAAPPKPKRKAKPKPKGS